MCVSLQTTRVYYDVCSALTLDPVHKEASRMKAELEEKATVCKNQVHTHTHTHTHYTC